MAYICVPLRCGLCRFNIDDGSKVVVGAYRGPTCRNLLTGVVTIDGIFFDTHESSPLVELPDYTYIECADASCERVCEHSDKQMMGCHSECYDLTTAEWRAGFFRITAPKFEPPATEDERRIRWL
ncbi:uncharacterized protein VDAG_02902 [Verticillium dahliae VdLs.17]|uniref:Uncharacterized protein n=1 Tax=Verticillium dahliae (strain VdLs.17 / ATCC MYA-4575 / FGSC 10137) TaxID=498257 RepID=G2WXC3_VERDV|nr:uncharacterized protein VDAG_02902 [Verticillium dahliae VdLs.17]EGY21378.1 hypothetical protein VDAG_02902 [Verticillium dahliae VdLs.17]